VGVDFQVNEVDFIMLDVTPGLDLDFDPTTFSRAQPSGPAAASFTGTNTAMPNVQFLSVSGADTTTTAQLTVCGPV